MDKDLHSHRCRFDLVFQNQDIYLIYIEGDKVRVSEGYSIDGVVFRQFEKIEKCFLPVEVKIKNRNVIWERFPDGDEFRYKYDEKDRLIWQKFPDGDKWEYRYDEEGKMVWQKFPDGKELHYHG